MTQNIVEILNFKVSNKLPLFLIAGPCSIESKEHAINHAGKKQERENDEKSTSNILDSQI